MGSPAKQGCPFRRILPGVMKKRQSKYRVSHGSNIQGADSCRYEVGCTT